MQGETLTPDIWVTAAPDTLRVPNLKSTASNNLNANFILITLIDRTRHTQMDSIEPESGSDSGHPCHSRCSDDSPEPHRPQDLSFNIRALRIHITNWQYPWGPENTWEKTFNDQLAAARDEGRTTIDNFFLDMEAHVREGRNILRDLKFVAEVSFSNTPDEIRDLFLQGYEMVMTVASEVKFCEVKLDEYAPAVPLMQMTNVRNHSGM
jgi:hypothetical protein